MTHKNTKITFEQLHDIYWRSAGMSLNRFARTIGISRRTAQRWRDGSTRIPPAALLAALHLAGEISHLGTPAWHGWRIRQGELLDPSGQAHSPASIMAWHWTAQQLSAWRARENQEAPEDLTGNLVAHPSRRPAHRTTDALRSRLTHKEDHHEALDPGNTHPDRLQLDGAGDRPAGRRRTRALADHREA